MRRRWPTRHPVPFSARDLVGSTVVWCDGGCDPNPGHAGIGCVVVEDGVRTEISEPIGWATNQVAELTAALRGLREVRDPTRRVVLVTDSEYAIGMLGTWRARANVELVAHLRTERSRFSDLVVRWVRGHSGAAENERCDRLATLGVIASLDAAARARRAASP